MENNEEKLQRFENKGSVKYLKKYDEQFALGKIVVLLFSCLVIGVIVANMIFGNTSIINGVIELLIISLICIVYDQILRITSLNNLYTRAKIGALEDEIK